MQRGEQVGFYAVSREHAGGLFCELVRKEARIISHADTAFLCARHGCEVVAKTLRRPADDVCVHAVGARADDAT
ncbi:hypothetical protein SDC9_116176 [bioreactor metagenome]|uniref:Uncharacterized protein n=1 Tax=bioreactor metagenome TaxID=1076179 RepID=A0A645BVF2_9ZZZZ